MSDLTLVLPTFGRAEFTQRFVDHATKLPFRILLDEGDSVVPVREWLKKLRDVCEDVETPYAMLCDNDDLPTVELGRCIEFLDFNPDYVCCSGRIQGFYQWPDLLTGPRSKTTPKYSDYDTPADYGQPNANDRVLAGFANSWSYFAVYRTEALRQIRREACELGLTNVQVHEKFCAMRTLTMGKACCIPEFTTYYRQYGTSHGPAWSEPGIDMIKVLSVMEGVDKDELFKRWMCWYAKRDRYFRGRYRKLAKRWFPNLARYVQNHYRYLP